VGLSCRSDGKIVITLGKGDSMAKEKTGKNTGKSKGTFARKPLWYKIFMITTLVIIMFLIGTIFYVYHLMALTNYDDGSDHVIQEDYFETVENPEEYIHLPEATLETAEKAESEGRSEKGIINILLLGLDQESGNLSDALIVVTLDTNNKAIKLTSFMRDMLVQIPGYANNKLNTPYQKGGIQLVYEVFSHNFDLDLDGYVAVNYNMLEKVIDKLGGITLYIDEAEANFQNTSNFISNPAYRNLIPGATQTLNGCQVVGYCRNRISLASSDFGRTQKQRTVLNAIYEKFKDQSLTDLLSLMETVLPYVTTDFDMMEMTSIATQVFESGLLSSDMEQFRIPIDGGYKDSWYNSMLVLDVDFDENIKALHSFIFGDDDTE